MIIGDILSMFPFLIVAYIANDMHVSGAFILMFISGVLHHYYIESTMLLIFDLVAILITLMIVTSKTKISEGIKHIIILLQSSILAIFVILTVFKIKLPWRIILIIMSIAWFSLFVYLAPLVSNTSKIVMVITLIIYMIRSCSCNPKYEMHNITWTTFHIFAALTTYFGLNDLKLIKPMFSIKPPL